MQKEECIMKNPFQGDLKKLKGMTLKGKADYIWEYYKMPIIIIIIAAIIIVSFVKAQLNHNPNAIQVYTVDITTPDAEVSEAALQEAFTNYLKLDSGAKKPLTIDSSITLAQGEDSYMTAMMQQKFSAVAASNSIDVMLAPEELVTYYTALGLFGDLEQMLPADLFNELKAKNMLITSTFDPSKANGSSEDEPDAAQSSSENLVTVYCGIKADNLRLLIDAGYDTEGAVIAVGGATKRPEASIEFVRMLVSMIK